MAYLEIIAYINTMSYFFWFSDNDIYTPTSNFRG